MLPLCSKDRVESDRMTIEPQALSLLDHPKPLSGQTIHIPSIQSPSKSVAVSPLGPSTRTDNGNLSVPKPNIHAKMMPELGSTRLITTKDISVLPFHENPAHLKDGPRKRQKLDFFQLPTPVASVILPSNAPLFPHIPVLNKLRQPPPIAARFPPIRPKIPHTQESDHGLQANSDHHITATTPPTGEDAKPKRHYTRIRRAWTEQETKDLLKGVEMFGAGRWKHILKHYEFHFHIERTSVDLKDRYRTYETSKSKLKKPRLPQKKSAVHEQKESLQENNPPLVEKLSEPVQFSKSSFDVTTVHDLKVQLANSVRLGAKLDQPQRFSRWTPAEDVRLIHASRKYGFKWTAMAQDPGLGLMHRTAGQIRGRFRVKFPQNYEHSLPLSFLDFLTVSKKSGRGRIGDTGSEDHQKIKPIVGIDEPVQGDSTDETSMLLADISDNLIDVVSNEGDMNIELPEPGTDQPAIENYTDTDPSSTADPNATTDINTEPPADPTSPASKEASIEADETRNLNIEALLNDDSEPLSQLPPLKFPFDQDWSGDLHDNSLTLAPMLWGGYDFLTGQWVGSVNV